MRTLICASLLLAGATVGAATVVLAQDALPPNYAQGPKDPGDGHAPGMKVTELGPRVRTFHITFQKGDNPAAGLAEFARKNNLTNAHFEAIGAFGSAVIGWSDRPMKALRWCGSMRRWKSLPSTAISSAMRKASRWSMPIAPWGFSAMRKSMSAIACRKKSA